MSSTTLATDEDGFTVKTIFGCRIVFGSVPLSQIALLTQGFSKKALMATDVAGRIGATLVIGEPDALDQLRKIELPISEKRQADARQATGKELHLVATWLLIGERGASSNAMCHRIFGVPREINIHHPYDPDDLRRCMLFLDATQAHDKVPLMADVSEPWARLVAKWDDLLTIFREEMKSGKNASRTYALMKEILR